MLMSSGYSIDHFGREHFTRVESVWEANSKIRLNGLAAANTIGEKLPMFVISQKAPDVARILESFPADTHHRIKAGWSRGYERSTTNFKSEGCSYHR